jgi:hypothetical protein
MSTLLKTVRPVTVESLTTLTRLPPAANGLIALSTDTRAPGLICNVALAPTLTVPPNRPMMNVP